MVFHAKLLQNDKNRTELKIPPDMEHNACCAPRRDMSNAVQVKIDI